MEQQPSACPAPSGESMVLSWIWIIIITQSNMLLPVLLRGVKVQHLHKIFGLARGPSQNILCKCCTLTLLGRLSKARTQSEGVLALDRRPRGMKVDNTKVLFEQLITNTIGRLTAVTSLDLSQTIMFK